MWDINDLPNQLDEAKALAKENGRQLVNAINEMAAKSKQYEEAIERLQALLYDTERQMVSYRHQALHETAQRRRAQSAERCLARTCFVILTDKAVTDTLWAKGDRTVTVVEDISEVLGFNAVADVGGPSGALIAKTTLRIQP
jgi:purine nucleoside permease